MYTATSDSAYSDTWTSWVNYETSNSTTSSTSYDGVWYEWTTNASTTYTSTSSDTTWTQWVEVSYSGEETDEGYVSQEVVGYERDHSNNHYKKIQKERAAAEIKATELLEVLIGKEQVEVYKETGRVFLKGKKFDYHIIKGSGFNIRKIEKDKVRDLCIHLRDRSIYPATDNVVALLLALQDDEEGVLNMANDHGNSDDTFVEELPIAAVAGC
jgi:hypothetical protein